MFEILILLGLLFLAWLVLTAVVSLTFTVFGFILMIVVWMFIGWIAGQLLRGKSYGPMYDALLGLGGAIVGNFVLGLAGVSLGGLIGTVIAGVIGSLILVGVIRTFKDKGFAR